MINTEYCGTCDRIRKTEQGESFWQDMILSKVRITESQFLRCIDIKPVLDSGETWQEYKSSAEDIKFYVADNAFFFQTAGFEFIWSKE